MKTLFLPPHILPKKPKILVTMRKRDRFVVLHCPAQLNSNPADDAAVCRWSIGLMQALFPSYTTRLQAGRTSFRPIEIAGRIPKSIRKDDTKLHVDAFPTSPTQGNRIIRVFTNVDPNQSPRVWRLGEPFEARSAAFLPQVKRPWFGRGLLLKTLS